MTDVGLVISRHDGVTTIQIDRPRVRNSLSNEVLAELARQLAGADADASTRAVVLAGSDTVFASGADLRELAQFDATELYFGERARSWDTIRRTRTPVVAAVSGICFGGGLELAMACDIVVADEGARFGLPETGLGLIPGAGGTQRLVRAIGKPVAMEVILAGRLLSAREAETMGLVARVTHGNAWLREAQRIGRDIAARSPVAVQLAKEAVVRSFDTGLESGLDAERKGFAIAFASADAREGIAAFLEKRKPRWGGAAPDGST